jgi:hypothetical protein
MTLAPSGAAPALLFATRSNRKPSLDRSQQQNCQTEGVIDFPFTDMADHVTGRTPNQFNAVLPRND